MQTTLYPKALRYLAAVAQLGSVQAAAREVSISASAIDRQILLLEEDLGVPLFERLPRGMQLTAAGELVLALSQRWKSDLNRTLSDIKQMQGVNQGQLRIAAMDSHANSFLPQFIHTVASEHPRIMLEVEIVNTDDAVRHLTGGEVDMAVAFNLRPQRDVQIVWTAELPLGCVVAKDHPLADRLQVTLQDVVDWPLAAQSRVLAIRRYLESKHAWLLAQARPPLVTNSLQLVKSLVRSGSHVAITSELDVGPELLAGDVRFIPLKDRNASPQTISVALSAGRSLPRIAKMVADILSEQVASYLRQVRQLSENAIKMSQITLIEAMSQEGGGLGSVSSSALPSDFCMSSSLSPAPPSPGLNLAQQEAVNYMHGPCLVLAGAGSGKTRVITHKIGRLIQAGMAPQRIAAITFTNKAAAEMRERAKGLIGRAAKDVRICTFHALGVHLLRADGAVLGLKPKFSILDTDDVTSILQEAGGSVDVATARQWQWAISAWKNQGLNAAQAQAQAKDDNELITARIMARYEERLTAYQSVDFDDLIGLPLKLLQNHEKVRTKWQKLMGHVLVDEYQDTNATQYEVLKLLVGSHDPKNARFTAVGDDDQSIYGWRGATLDNLKKLPLDFPDLKVIKLEQNYRSTGAILRAANNVIGPNPKLFPKNLWSDLGEGEPVRVVDADHEEHEAERTVARIQSLRSGNTVLAPLDAAAPSGASLEFRNFAVLYRANHQARVFEKALRKANIPYKVSGGQSFFDRAEIKDLCGWFRLWVNNDDDPAFLRAVTTPKRGIGHQTLQQLGTFGSQYKLSLFDALFSSSLAAVMSTRAVGSLHEFGRYVNDLEYRARHTEGAEDALAFLLAWLKEIDYEKHLYDGEDSANAAASRWKNVLDFCEWMALRCGGEIDDAAGVTTSSEKKSLMEVAQTISLLSTISEREQDRDVVTLSTLHAAKGLEWPHVMLVGVTEGLLPFKLGDGADALGGSERDHESANEDMAQRLQEERRLMYVGITRAQRSLAVSWTRRRKKGREMIVAQPSRFIAEMGLDQATVKEDPREKLRALRAEFAKKALDAAASATQAAVLP